MVAEKLPDEQSVLSFEVVGALTILHCNTSLKASCRLKEKVADTVFPVTFGELFIKFIAMGPGGTAAVKIKIIIIS